MLWHVTVASRMGPQTSEHGFHRRRSLALYNNMSDDNGAAAIAGLLGRAPRMESFRMASSRVGAAGGIALAEGLSQGDQPVQLARTLISGPGVSISVISVFI